MITPARRNRGFMLATVLVVLALVGCAMVILAGATRQLQADTNRALSQAYRSNLLASGRAWVRAKAPADRTAVHLDTAGLDVPESKLSIRFAGDGDGIIDAEYHCPFSRRITHLSRRQPAVAGLSADAAR